MFNRRGEGGGGELKCLIYLNLYIFFKFLSSVFLFIIQVLHKIMSCKSNSPANQIIVLYNYSLCEYRFFIFLKNTLMILVSLNICKYFFSHVLSFIKNYQKSCIWIYQVHLDFLLQKTFAGNHKRIILNILYLCLFSPVQFKLHVFLKVFLLLLLKIKE